MGKADREHRLKDLDARGKSATAFGAIFVVVGSAIYADLLPSPIRAIAGALAIVGLTAALLFYVDARRAGLEVGEAEVERERAELDRRVHVPIAPIDKIDTIRIGVDAAAQDIVPGGQIPEYVPRNVDEQLHAAITKALDGSGRRIIVTVGTSKVGKSRSLFEALKFCARDLDLELELVAPSDGDALRSLLTPDQLPPLHGRRAVLWLDDLEPFLNQDVTAHTLREWHATFPTSVIAATYGGKGSERVPAASSGALSSLAEEVLAQACEIPMTATTSTELGDLRATVSRSVFQALERHGLAAYLVAAPTLERKLNTSRHAGGPVSPEGVAVVYAVVDWARCGRTDAITQDTLRGLWPTYLRDGIAATDDRFAAALEWAQRPVAGTVALLQGTGGSYEAFDYIVRFVHNKPGATPPRDETWRAALETATGAQALTVATIARLHGRIDGAITALDRARRSTVSEVAAIAGHDLGVLLGDSDRPNEAVAVFDDVVARFDNSPEPLLREMVAGALLNKGTRLLLVERPQAALPALDEVVARFADAPQLGLRGRVAAALINKGKALSQLDRHTEAIAVYDDVVARFADAPQLGLRMRVAAALVAKGVALRKLDRESVALVVFDEVVARFDNAEQPEFREHVGRALINKGGILSKLDHKTEALAVLDDVAARFDNAARPELREYVGWALLNKSAVLSELDRVKDADAALDDVVARFANAAQPELREHIAKSMVNRGTTLSHQLRCDEAVAVFDDVIIRFDDAALPQLRQHVALALLSKAVMLVMLARSEEAITAFDDVVARFDDVLDPAQREAAARVLDRVRRH